MAWLHSITAYALAYLKGNLILYLVWAPPGSSTESGSKTEENRAHPILSLKDLESPAGDFLHLVGHVMPKCCSLFQYEAVLCPGVTSGQTSSSPPGSGASPCVVEPSPPPQVSNKIKLQLEGASRKALKNFSFVTRVDLG